MANEPAPILCLLPTEADCRDYMVSDLEPTFQASPALRGALSREVDHGEDRSTILHRLSRADAQDRRQQGSPEPRRHTARVLFVDEADAMEPSAEGAPILLAEKRTLSFADRKIVVGSTPLIEETSTVLRSYGASDQRVFEVPCPSCGGYAEVLWQHIEWESEHPETAAFRCPHCQSLIDERHKPAMVEAGHWRATRPEVSSHHGYRLNALVSPLANASGQSSRRSSCRRSTIRRCCNRSSIRFSRKAGALPSPTSTRATSSPRRAVRDRRHPARGPRADGGLGPSGRPDRDTLCGWSRDGQCLVLDHVVHWGPPDEDRV